MGNFDYPWDKKTTQAPAKVVPIRDRVKATPEEIEEAYEEMYQTEWRFYKT